jgi:hypothetical protein
MQILSAFSQNRFAKITVGFAIAVCVAAHTASKPTRVELRATHFHASLRHGDNAGFNLSWRD